MDLEQYGSIEHALFLQNRDEYSFFWNISPFVSSGDWEYRLIGFSYGPLVKDWHFWFSDPVDDLIGDFWAMVEYDANKKKSAGEIHLEQPSIPGSWIS